MIEFELNGKKITVPEGTTIIEAADTAGEYIPRFCYHKKLSIAANCRMCLVEVEKSGKPLPACATPITPDMKVKTKSDMAIKAQRDVMEFLLINHPLDCPICDQGGECELQDLSMGFGRAKSEYNQPKRAVCSEDIGPLVETEMTRCIQCTRCVRFGEEVAGLRELGVVNRGEKEEIGTYVQHFLQSEVSGNVIDLCPVGALTNKPARYAMRGWEVKEHASIAPHDCVGTNVFLHSKGIDNSATRHVFRSVPRENQAINETWMSDRDRFAVEALYHEDRVYKPRMKKNNKWVEVEWAYALEAIAHLTQHIQKEKGADQVAGIAGYCATTEEYYLLQKLMRALGSNNVDHRIRESDFTDQLHRPLFPKLNKNIAEIEECDAILLVGSNVRQEQPMVSTRIFKAAQDGLQVMAVNTVEYPFVFALSHKIIDDNIVQSLADIVRALEQQKQAASANGDESANDRDNAARIAHQLLSSKQAAIFVGPYALRHPHASVIRNLVHRIAHLSGATAGILSEGANSAGAWIAGCIPHRDAAGAPLIHVGRDAKALLTTDPADAYFILDTELENDSAYPEQAIAALTSAKLVVCLSTFASEKMHEYADFILPIAPYSENNGSFVNACGLFQSFEAVGPCHGESKPAWKVLRALAMTMKLSGFSYESVNQICDEIHGSLGMNPSVTSETLSHNSDVVLPKYTPVKVPQWHMYRDNPLVRRAKSLQKTICNGGDHA
jgi:NADH-quinone oxidoreductase subunit G